MRLCLPCIGALEDAGAKVHVRLTSDEVRAQLRVIDATYVPPPPTEEQVRTAAAFKRCTSLFLTTAIQAVEFAIGNKYLGERRKERAIELLEAALARSTGTVIKAAAATGKLEREEKRETERREKARRALTAELRQARARRTGLRREAALLEVTIERRRRALAPAANRTELAAQMQRARDRLSALRAAIRQDSSEWTESRAAPLPGFYPEVPRPWLSPSKEGDGLPESSGIYFLWAGDVVEYVGQSIKLCNRARLGHHRLKPTHRISYVLVERRELTWAECWYIGVLRPKLNFGEHASHTKHET